MDTEEHEQEAIKSTYVNRRVAVRIDGELSESFDSHSTHNPGLPFVIVIDKIIRYANCKY